MLFNSYIFIFIFLPITLLGYYLISHRRAQLLFLFLASVFFYAYWSKIYVFLLLLTVALDFYVAKAIFYSTSQRQRKFLLFTSMSINLSILGFFKYYNFFAQNINTTLAWLPESVLQLSNAGALQLPVFSQLVLPIGISFYTFQSMSYVIDVYRKTSSAHGQLLEFASYVTFFPHQISGPLVRHNSIVPQLQSAKTYLFNSTHFWNGCYFFIFGLAKKILIADRLAAVVDPLVGNMAAITNTEAWLAMIGYTMQLYYDFSGYSEMAVGLGFMMNIQFPQNFNSPYKSKSITEFWQRWHITLSSWLRDYLYISLGGNRGSKLATYRNLLLTMIIGGFWHGANWTYLLWGLLHGMALTVERFLKDKGWSLIKNSFMQQTLTLFFVALAWIFFRSPDATTALLWLQKIFFLNNEISLKIFYIATNLKDRFIFSLIIAIIGALFCKNIWQHSLRPNWFHAFLLALLFAVSLTYMGDESPFLYFQF